MKTSLLGGFLIVEELVVVGGTVGEEDEGEDGDGDAEGGEGEDED